MVEEWVYAQPDFAAQLQVFPQPEIGLRCLLRQGLKLDLMYQDDQNVAWIIYYALLNPDGSLLPKGAVCEGDIQAYFRILNPELRLTVHRPRIQIGTRFYVVAGSHRVAEGVVTEIMHLGHHETE